MTTFEKDITGKLSLLCKSRAADKFDKGAHGQTRSKNLRQRSNKKRQTKVKLKTSKVNKFETTSRFASYQNQTFIEGQMKNRQKSVSQQDTCSRSKVMQRTGA